MDGPEAVYPAPNDYPAAPGSFIHIVLVKAAILCGHENRPDRMMLAVCTGAGCASIRSHSPGHSASAIPPVSSWR
jgi:hypothetical protein